MLNLVTFTSVANLKVIPQANSNWTNLVSYFPLGHECFGGVNCEHNVLSPHVNETAD